MSENKSEKATPQRKKKAREKGDWVRSRELLAGCAMLAGMLSLGAAGGQFAQAWRRSYQSAVQFAVSTRESAWDATHAARALHMTLLPALLPVAWILAATFFAALGAGFAQSGGLQLNPGSLAPKLSRVSIGTHAKQMFSVRPVVRVVKSIVPAAAVAWLGWRVVQHSASELPVMSVARLPLTFSAAYGLCVQAAVISVVWSAIDYVVEWRAWNQRLKMSKQEMREEIKEAMGNPQVKGKIRQMQRAMRKRKAKVDMTRATVVITNPTHYAVALQFSFETMAAPTVLGKGRDLHALDMREEARWAGVPVIENPPLARSLYRSVEPGQAIPYELYAAIAGILAFLYREQNEAREREERSRTPPMQATQMYGFQGGM